MRLLVCVCMWVQDLTHTCTIVFTISVCSIPVREVCKQCVHNFKSSAPFSWAVSLLGNRVIKSNVCPLVSSVEFEPSRSPLFSAERNFPMSIKCVHVNKYVPKCVLNKWYMLYWKYWCFEVIYIWYEIQNTCIFISKCK